MPSSPIRKLVPFADKAKERGIKVYHLNIGQPDIPTPQVALDALKNCHEKVIAYTHSAGNISYRKKLAKYYQNIGIDIDETNIMVTTGGSEAITIAFMSTLNPGDEVIITNLWETLRYTVTQTKIIEPDDVESIYIQPGRDMVTLMTCHPFASGGRYRYLVYCDREK